MYSWLIDIGMCEIYSIHYWDYSKKLICVCSLVLSSSIRQLDTPSISFYIYTLNDSHTIDTLCTVQYMYILCTQYSHPSMLELMTWLHFLEGFSKTWADFWQSWIWLGIHCTSLTAMLWPSFIAELAQYSTIGAWSSFGSVSNTACVYIYMCMCMYVCACASRILLAVNRYLMLVFKFAYYKISKKV